MIGCEDRLRNDLYCVGWGVKLYSNQTKGREVREPLRVSGTVFFRAGLLLAFNKQYHSTNGSSFLWFPATFIYYSFILSVL